MTERPKRTITKPPRYMTTSSEEEPKRRRMQERGTVDNIFDDIDNDIAELRGTQIANTDNSQINTNTDNTDAPTLSQNLSTHIVHNSSQSFPILTEQPSLSLPPVAIYQNSYPGPSSRYNVPAQSSTYTTYNYPETRKTYYTNSKHSQFQISQYPTITEHTGSFQEAAGNPRTELDNFFRTLNKRMDCFEAEIKAEIKKLDGTLQNILRHVEVHRERRGVPRKPDGLPVCDMTGFNAFEAIDDDGFAEAVSYLEYIGGFNLKEAVNLCVKEVLTDDATALFTWCGRDGLKPLYNARIIIAIYEAVCKNRHFAKPARKDFQLQMQVALRAAKERYRSKVGKARAVEPNRNQARDFWNDEAPNETTRPDNDN